MLRGVTARFGDLTAIRDLSLASHADDLWTQIEDLTRSSTPRRRAAPPSTSVSWGVFDAVAWIAAVLLVRDALVD